MTPEQLQKVVEAAVQNSLPNWYVLGLYALLGGIAGALGAFFGPYLQEHGKRAATKEDFKNILREVEETTKATKEIEAKISDGLWLGQQRWNRKWECYVEIVRSLGEVHTLIVEVLSLNPARADYQREFLDRTSRANEAFLNSRKFGAVARIAVAPSVRTVVTRFGSGWNRAQSDREKGIAARWGWLVVTDIAATIFSANAVK
jgi:hypothetical protein